jgi:hypothetical protein
MLPAADDPEDATAELARLRALLDEHRIAWRRQAEQPTAPPPDLHGSRLTTAAKVALIRRLFRGREDVFALRWESSTSHKSGYAPACANEWRPGVCEKPRIACSVCQHRALRPLTDQVIYDHLAGTQTVGVYPLMPDNTCHFLAIDFDDADWRADTVAFAATCDAFEVPVALEISR